MEVLWLWYTFQYMDTKIIGYIVVLVIVLGGAIGGLWYLDQQAAPKREAYTNLAQCLSERGVVFYGAFWCPACAQQKTMFGSAAKQLPYTECSLPDRSQNEMCTEAEIANYPVWEFDGNYRCGGVTTPEVLAHLSGCDLPAYEGVESTPSALFDRLVVTASNESLKKRGIAQSDIDAYIVTTTEGINTYLTEQYGMTLETVEDSAHLLAAIAEVLHSCAPYEKQAVVESEGVEIEVVPNSGGEE